MEVHPDSEQALSESPNMVPPANRPRTLLEQLLAIRWRSSRAAAPTPLSHPAGSLAHLALRVFVSAGLASRRALMGCALLVLESMVCHRRWPVLRTEGEPLKRSMCAMAGNPLIQSLARGLSQCAGRANSCGGPSGIRHVPGGIKDKPRIVELAALGVREPDGLRGATQ